MSDQTTPNPETNAPATEELRIQATPSLTGEAIDILIYPPIYRGLVASFSSAEAAEGSPLPKRLFEVEGMKNVFFSNRSLRVTMDRNDINWQEFGPKIGQIIRDQHATGEKPLAEDYQERMSDDDKLRSEVQQVLDSDINPQIAMHGGYIQLLNVEDSNLFIEMGGGCQGCGMASVTLRQGVESMLREKFPELGHIFDTTDHASGQNPYYAGDPAQ